MLNRLMEFISPMFEGPTLAAFHRISLDGIASVRAAEVLGLSLNAVLVAKSLVLNRSRQEVKR